MGIEYKFTGFDNLRDMLAQLPEKVENKVIQGAVIGAMREARKDISNATPRHVDKQSPASKKYGPGWRNIRVQRLRRHKKGERGARVSTGKAFWLFIFEKGSRYQPARPFFLPAFRAATGKLIDSLKKSIGEGIIREANKLKR